MSDKTVHMIGQAHIDPVWLWRWPEGYAEICATYRSALDRMNEDPNFIFVSACASYYRWIERNQPGMFEEIRARVREGRWALAGGWWVQPDCNAPSGESFVRHALYSQRYLQDVFGRIADVGYNVDSFGHCGSLPQILKGSGLNAYVFMRPMPHENPDIPASLFLWEGVDGTCIPTYRLPVSYNCAGVDAQGVPRVFERVDEIYAIAERENAPQMCFYGVGNHGGGPTRELLSHISTLKGARHFPVKYSSPSQFFAEAAQITDRLPVHTGDLQFHAKGCYSTTHEIKKANRRAENALGAAEKLSSLAHLLLDRPYENGALQHAWERVLNNQFHDVMGGCCVRAAVDDAVRFYGEAQSIADEQTVSAAQRLSWAIDTSAHAPVVREKNATFGGWEFGDNGSPVVVFNSLGWPVVREVTCNYPIKGLTDEAGVPVPYQEIKAPYIRGENTVQTLFRAQIPALGYRVFWAYQGKEMPEALSPALSVCGNVLENEHLRVEIDPETGGVTSLLDKGTGVKTVCGSRALEIDMGDADTWAHGVSSFRDEAGAFACTSIEVLEQGPVRAVIRTKAAFGESEIVQDYRLSAGAPHVDVAVRIFARMARKMVKLAFSTPLSDTKLICEVAYGAIVRASDGAEQHGQQFVELRGEAGGKSLGLAVINDAKYSYDALDGELRLTALNTSYYADHFGKRIKADDANIPMDQGLTEFNYRLIPRAEDGLAALARAGQEFNAPEVLVQETYHEGPLPERFEGIRVSAPNVLPCALKLAEDGGGYVLRLLEADGKACRTDIVLPPLKRSFSADFARMEIKNFYIPLDINKPVASCDLIERPLK